MAHCCASVMLKRALHCGSAIQRQEQSLHASTQLVIRRIASYRNHATLPIESYASGSRSVHSTQSLYGVTRKGDEEADVEAGIAADSDSRRDKELVSHVEEGHNIKAPAGTRSKESLAESFFSAASQPSGIEHVPSEGAKKLSENSLRAVVISECDKAIVLSRGSSDPKSFLMASTCLERATKALWPVLGQMQAQSNIDYEIYVLRTSYAHVLRIVGALAGRQSALISSAIMLNFLTLEADLAKIGIQTPDGSTEWLQTRKRGIGPPMSLKRREQELQEIYLIAAGPFVHDMAPILYDLFADLTKRELHSDGKHVSWARGFSSELHYNAAHKIWAALKALGPSIWTMLSEVDPRQFRHHVHANLNLQTGTDVIDACAVMYANACLQSDKMGTAIALWKGESRANKLWTGKGEKILELISRKLRFERRSLLRSLDADSRTSGKRDTFKKASTSYVESLVALVELVQEEDALTLSAHFDQIVRTVLKSSFLLGTKCEPHSKAAADYEVALASMLKWIVRRMEEGDAQATDRAFHLLLSTSTCNVLLLTLLRIKERDPQNSQTLILLLRAMMSNSRFPQPDRTTWTIMLSNPRILPDLRIIPASLQAAHSMILSQDQVVNSNEKTQIEDTVQKTSQRTESTDDVYFYELLKEAVAVNDEHRVLALLNLAKQSRYLNLALAKTGHAANITPITASRLVFSLYPSLDLTRPARTSLDRRQRWRVRVKVAAAESGNSYKKPSREEIIKRENGVQFNLYVLTSVLQFVVSRHKTGLAERLWRLIWRVARRKAARRAKQSSLTASTESKRGETIPTAAFTEMLRLYAFERRSAARVAKLRVLPPYKRAHLSSRLRSFLARDVVRGWGRYDDQQSQQAVPVIKMRCSTAREGAIRCYEQMRSLWPDQNPSKALNCRPDVQTYNQFFAVFSSSGRVHASAVLEPRLKHDQMAFLHTVIADVRCLDLPTPKFVQHLY